MIQPSNAQAFQHNISHSSFNHVAPDDVSAAQHSEDLMASAPGGTLVHDTRDTQDAKDAAEICRVAQRMLRAPPTAVTFCQSCFLHGAVLQFCLLYKMMRRLMEDK